MIKKSIATSFTKLAALAVSLSVGDTYAYAAGAHAVVAKTYTVTIENMAFTPATSTIRPNDRVVWINKDLFPHTVTADNKAFDSQSIAANASWTYVATQRGEYSYLCTFHPTMLGKLIVR